MRRLALAVLAVSVLAVLAGIGAARAQTPAWNAAVLNWRVPDAYRGIDPSTECETGPCDISYIVEAFAPGGTEWTPLAVVRGTSYTATNLYPGEWRFRVRSSFGGVAAGDPSPEGVKTIRAPGLPTPNAPTINP